MVLGANWRLRAGRAAQHASPGLTGMAPCIPNTAPSRLQGGRGSSSVDKGSQFRAGWDVRGFGACSWQRQPKPERAVPGGGQHSGQEPVCLPASVTLMQEEPLPRGGLRFTRPAASALGWTRAPAPSPHTSGAHHSVTLHTVLVLRSSWGVGHCPGAPRPDPHFVSIVSSKRLVWGK